MNDLTLALTLIVLGTIALCFIFVGAGRAVYKWLERDREKRGL